MKIGSGLIGSVGSQFTLGFDPCPASQSKCVLQLQQFMPGQHLVLFCISGVNVGQGRLGHLCQQNSQNIPFISQPFHSNIVLRAYPSRLLCCTARESHRHAKFQYPLINLRQPLRVLIRAPSHCHVTCRLQALWLAG